MSIQLFNRIKNKMSILVVFFIMISMIASAVSALSVQPDIMPPGGKYVQGIPASPLHGSSTLEYIPPSGIVKPGDTGNSSHTNYRILVLPNNTSIQPVSQSQALNNL